ncbi:MAG: sialate O-acetylesterase [Ginsengibacter sp.]
MDKNISHDISASFLKPCRSSVRAKKLQNYFGCATLFCIFISISFLTMSQTNHDHGQRNTVDSSFDLYLLIGQSNMAGRGVLTEKFKDEGNANVFMLTKENSWVPAKNPLHFDKPTIAGVGPGLSFGLTMEKAKPSHKIGLIPCAVGGTSIDVWEPGAFDKATKTHPYDDMLLRLDTALKSGVLRGILWLQGESDSSPENVGTYLQKLEKLIHEIRTVAGNDKVPFVAGQLGRYKAQYQLINHVLKLLPADVPYTDVASSKGLTDKGDQTHFNSESQEKMGRRMAKKMKSIQKRIKNDEKFLISGLN